MPIQTRCPSCAAVVPSSAAWCSLCHADLRPQPDPASVDLSDDSYTVIADGSELDEIDAERGEDAPSGRHAAYVPAGPEGPRSSVGGSGGRHAAGRVRVASRASTRGGAPRPAEAVLDGLELPTGRDVTPEQVEALADQMLTRLAVTENRSNVLDPNDLPGGKWGFVAALTAATVVLLLAVGTVVGFVVGR